MHQDLVVPAGTFLAGKHGKNEVGNLRTNCGFTTCGISLSVRCVLNSLSDLDLARSATPCTASRRRPQAVGDKARSIKRQVAGVSMVAHDSPSGATSIGEVAPPAWRSTVDMMRPRRRSWSTIEVFLTRKGKHRSKFLKIGATSHASYVGSAFPLARRHNRLICFAFWLPSYRSCVSLTSAVQTRLCS